jgi:hypothetical protein
VRHGSCALAWARAPRQGEEQSASSRARVTAMAMVTTQERPSAFAAETPCRGKAKEQPTPAPAMARAQERWFLGERRAAELGFMRGRLWFLQAAASAAAPPGVWEGTERRGETWFARCVGRLSTCGAHLSARRSRGVELVAGGQAGRRESVNDCVSHVLVVIINIIETKQDLNPFSSFAKPKLLYFRSLSERN